MKSKLISVRHNVFFCAFLPLSLLSLTVFFGSVLSATTASADDSVVDDVNITVPVSCSMSGTGMDSHNANISNGTYQPNIGTTTIHAFCNDNEGFAIYAAGYTGDEIGATNSNKLVGTNASGNSTIDTGLATTAGTPDVSNWAMKLAITQDSGDTAGTNAFTIDSDTEGPFSTYHTVPNAYTKVAHKTAATNMTTSTGGVKLTTTYAAYISKNQSADTYTGQVKYTLVHPHDANAPIAHPAILDTGKTVNSKLKSLAATVVSSEEATITPEFDPEGDYDYDYAYDEYIKSINVHLKTPAPTGFTPTEKNTISSLTSNKPIYIVFDNTNDVGIMHFYTEGDQIVLPSDSSFMFYMLYNLSEISSISDWNASSVTDMSSMFYNAGDSASAFALDLSSWDTSSVTDMSSMFCSAGNSATTFALDLSSWDTSSVTDMSSMFQNAGNSATTLALNLSSWDTSSVTDMSWMFFDAGYSATTFTLDLSSWSTSSVTDMSSMFSGAGYSATTFALDLSSWDTSNVINMNNMFSITGYSANSWSISGLSSWDTSNATDMSWMFYGASCSASAFVLDLSSWDTSSVTDMSGMFQHAGDSATTFTLDLSSWDTSNVTDMSMMFSGAGYSASIWSVTIPQTNGNNISNTTSRIYGKTTSVYDTPSSGKTFTLAQL